MIRKKAVDKNPLMRYTILIPPPGGWGIGIIHILSAEKSGERIPGVSAG